MFIYRPKDPYYALEHSLTYMIILNDHFLWYLALNLDAYYFVWNYSERIVILA